MVDTEASSQQKEESMGDYELPDLELFQLAKKYSIDNPDKVAVVDVKAETTLTFSQLLLGAAQTKDIILRALGISAVGISGGEDLQEQRIAFLVPPGSSYVQIQWGVWAAGGIAVPLCTTHPFKELEYTIQDSDPSLILLHQDFVHYTEEFRTAFPEVRLMTVPFPSGSDASSLSRGRSLSFSKVLDPSRRALIIYTSGTTSKPKGCVTTHENISFQAKSLIKAWKYTTSDHLIHVLPLHHVHGIINGLTATLMAGGTVEMHPKFDAEVVWRRWIEGGSTMFMAVPTVYSRLNSYFTEKLEGTVDKQRAIQGARDLRVLISGSAALPVNIKEKFKDITGQVLLERYGMTEIGMALSCKYDDSDGRGRMDGSVGWPLEGVDVRLVNEAGEVVDGNAEGEGQIQVRGLNVFLEYWKKPEETAKEFTDDKYFKTGDVAFRDANGAYFIRGRSSVDIIKSGGYKISALDVEREISSCIPGVKEVAVIGVPDEEWGQRVGAVVSLEEDVRLELKELRNGLKSHLAPYKIPTLLKEVKKIERNAMGKVNKKLLLHELWPQT